MMPKRGSDRDGEQLNGVSIDLGSSLRGTTTSDSSKQEGKMPKSPALSRYNPLTSRTLYTTTGGEKRDEDHVCCPNGWCLEWHSC